MPNLHEVDFFTSHEALILGYEEALTRQDSLTGDWYDCSAHMLWIGERTRQLDGAHVEFFARRRATRSAASSAPRPRPTRSLALCEALNPDRIPGRLTLITRMGADKVERRPAAAARRRPRRRPPGGVGVRPDARQHLHRRRAAARPATSTTSSPRSPASSPPTAAEGTWPGGVHVELTGDDVTECLGGAEEILDADLDDPLRDDVRPPPQRPPVARPRLPGRPSSSRAG